MSELAGLCVLGHGSDQDGQPIHARADTGLLLCRLHRRRLDRDAQEIRQLWYDLTFILEAGTAPKDETPRTRHLKAAEAPSPANLEALALRDPRSSSVPLPLDQSTPIPAVLSIVASWVLLVAEERPITTALPQSVIAQSQLLERHGDWIAAQGWVDDFMGEMGELRKALRLAVRDVTHRVLGKCRLPSEDGERACGGSLLQENGSDVVRCAACGAQWSTPQERARLSMSLESA